MTWICHLHEMHFRPDIQSVPIRLREFSLNDFEALWRIDQSCFEEGIAYSRAELLHYIELKTAFTVVAEIETGGTPQICGFVIAHRRRGGFGHVLTIDVLPEFRQQKIGSRLLSEVHSRLERQGCQTVFLETAVNNVAAIAFYKRHGYEVLRTIPRYYHATGMDAFLLSRKLSPTSTR